MLVDLTWQRDYKRVGKESWTWLLFWLKSFWVSLHPLMAAHLSYLSQAIPSFPPFHMCFVLINHLPCSPSPSWAKSEHQHRRLLLAIWITVRYQRRLDNVYLRLVALWPLINSISAPESYNHLRWMRPIWGLSDDSQTEYLFPSEDVPLGPV